MVTIEQPKSVLHELLQQVQTMDLETARSTTIAFLDKASIRNEDKRKMKMVVQYQTHTHARLVQYLYNAMLAFEGLGVVK